MKSRYFVAILVALLFVVASESAAGARVGAKVQPRPSEGCGSSKFARGEQRVDTTSGGVERWYFRYLPRVYDGTTALPIVLDLHGHSEGALVHRANSALGTFGHTHGFITVTPQGSGQESRWDTPADSADMKFLVDLLDEVEQTLCVDQRRVFVTGYSNGAFMASAMSCLFADRIAAVAPVAGIRDVPGCRPTRPVPVVAFHGVADPFVAFEGGLGPGVTNLPPADAQQLIDVAAPTESGLSIPGVTAAWAARNGCDPQATEKAVGPDVTLVRHACPNHADVQLYEIRGGGHTWPGSQFSKSIEPFVGKTTFSIDADAVMWKFFQQHPLRGAG